jgi:uncharacterized membrane protein
MISFISAINWLSVLAAFAIYFILGALWFTLFFKKSYRISLGKENTPEEKPAPIFIIGPAICLLVITITTAILMLALDIHSVQSAVEFALLIGFGYLVANTVNIAINPNIPKPILYGIISGSYHLVGITIVAILLYVMN